jgi:hypothetical protein
MIQPESGTERRRVVDLLFGGVAQMDLPRADDFLPERSVKWKTTARADQESPALAWLALALLAEIGRAHFTPKALHSTAQGRVLAHPG